MGERFASVDIGTNSTLLLIVERGPDGLRAIVERSEITRLGQDVDKTHQLANAAVDRTLTCLEAYAELLRQTPPQKLAVVGTSAMRDAHGAEAFRQRVADVLGAEPRVISGQEEAELTFAGGCSGMSLSGARTVFDIGGGSTEVIQGESGSDETSIGFAQSLDIGSVRLTERCLRSDPPRPAELDEVRAIADAALAGLPARPSGPLVGVAGTVTTLAAVSRKMSKYDGAVLHGSPLSQAEVVRLVGHLASMSSEARANLPGLPPKRADVIVAGAVIVERLLRWANAHQMVVSDRGVRWGLVEKLASTPN